MALTKVTKTGIADNAIDADKIEDGTIVAADVAPGTITTTQISPTAGIVSGQIAPGTIANDRLANTGITINGTTIALGASGTIIAGTDWQAVKTTDFTAVAGEGYFVDTTSAAVEVTLPGSPSAGDTVSIKDYAGTFGTNALTIARNGNNIQGIANDSEITTNRASVVLVYIDATKGWLYTNESNVADLQQALFISATGGTITTDGDYKVHVFTGDGCFVVANTGNGPTVPTGGPANVDYLVIAGGGSGAVAGAGGGGFRTSYPSPAGVIPVTATTYPVQVGAGGGGKGTDSIFSTITSTGGGGGEHYVSPTGVGQPGGSGGGGARVCSVVAGGTGNTPPVSPPQGNPGGPSGPDTSQITGGGGGGAATAGSTGPGPGGAGAAIATAFFGPVSGCYGEPGPSGRYFSGGGGGSLHQPGEATQPGGIGGGGDGKPGTLGAPSNGTTNTGGGGGGSTSPGGFTKNGGKGLVVIRYKFQ